jgi:hypothetical protein
LFAIIDLRSDPRFKAYLAGIQILGPYLEDTTPIDIAGRIVELTGALAPPPLRMAWYTATGLAMAWRKSRKWKSRLNTQAVFSRTHPTIFLSYSPNSFRRPSYQTNTHHDGSTRTRTTSETKFWIMAMMDHDAEIEKAIAQVVEDIGALFPHYLYNAQMTRALAYGGMRDPIVA